MPIDPLGIEAQDPLGLEKPQVAKADPLGLEQPPQQPSPFSQIVAEANRPTTHLPRVADIAPYVERLMPSLATNTVYQTGKPILAGVMDRLSQDVEGFTSPVGLGLMTGAAAPGIVGQFLKAALPSYFGVKAATQDLPQAAQEAGKVFGTPGSTPEQKAGALTGMVTPAFMAAGGIGAALPVRGVPEPIRLKDIPVERPVVEPQPVPPPAPTVSSAGLPLDPNQATIPLDVEKINQSLQPPPNEQPINQTPQQPEPSPTPQAAIVQPEASVPAQPQQRSGQAPEELRAGPPQGEPLNAPQERQEPSGLPVERPGVNPQRTAPEAGVSDSLRPEAKGVGAPQEPVASLEHPLTPEEQANEQRLLQEAHAEPGGPTGIAQRVREKVAATGKEELPPRGEGISAAESVERGDSLLTADPTAADRHMVAFEADPHKAVSAEAIATGRAKLRQLAQAANRAEEQFGTKSPEYEAAFRARSDWSARVKKMQTEWHRSGMAQQGEQDIDTGTFTGLRSAYVDDTGRDFTPQQAKQAKDVATGVKTASDAVETAKTKLNEVLAKTGKEKAADTPEGKVWSKVRDYLEKGEDNFDDVRNKVATDLGMPVKDVTDILTKNKTAKRLADDVWLKQERERRFKAVAKRWLKGAAIPGWEKALATLPQATFASKVGFHGLLAEGSHAPMLFFQPRFWANYFRDFAKTYKLVGVPSVKGQAKATAYYEMQVQDLLRNKNYITARRAGLQNDPHTYEEYASIPLQDKISRGLEKIDPKVAATFNSLTGMGNRGYAVLKILRQDIFDQRWNKLPESRQTPEMAKEIAEIVNHVTGVTEKGAPTGANLMLFAPRLWASRFMWLAGDPIKAARIRLNWKNATDAQKYFALEQVKEKAWVVGTHLALLAINQGMLSLTGSEQKINFTNPMKGDFLQFKGFGARASFGGAMVNTAKLPVKIGAELLSDGGKLKNVVYPDEDVAKTLLEYARSQASPIANIAMDLAFRADFQNRPLPNSNRPVPKRLQAQGIGPYSWPEWALESVAPIPAEEALKEVWKYMGMNEEQRKDARFALGVAAIFAQGATGGRLAEDTQSVSPLEKQRQQVAGKMFPGQDITPDLEARASVVEKIKQEAPGQPGDSKFLDQLSPRVQSYLRKEKVNVPTAQEEVTINKQQVPLNEDEQAYYDKLVLEKYTQYFNEVTQQEDFKSQSRYDKQLQVNSETAKLRKEARQELKDAIADKAVPSLKKKP